MYLPSYACFGGIMRSLLIALFLSSSLIAENWQFTVLDSFPKPGLTSAVLQKAVALDIDFAGNVYIIDKERHRLLKYDGRGRLIKEIGGFGNAAEQFDDPRDVFAHTTLDVFVADYNNNRVVRFDKNLNFLNNLLPQWPDPYQFDRVLSMAVSSQYDLFLLEDGEKKVIKFSRFSEPTEVFGGIRETFGQLLEPVQITVNGSKQIFVSDPAQRAVVVFDYLGNYLTMLQHPSMEQPEGLCWGDDRRLYIVDTHSNALFIFSENLKFITSVPFPPPVNNIVDVAVSFNKDSGTRLLYALSHNRCWLLQLTPSP